MTTEQINEMTNGIGDSGSARIAEERIQQIIKHGYEDFHDDEHVNGEIADAALCYLLAANGFPARNEERRSVAEKLIGEAWPFSESFSPSSERATNLVKAGALIAAEIDRLQRLRARTEAR